MEKIAIIMGKMHSGGKKNLVMEYYRNIDKNEIQFDFLCDTDSNAIPKEEIEKLGGTVYEITPYQNIFKNIKDKNVHFPRRSISSYCVHLYSVLFLFIISIIAHYSIQIAW